MIERSSWNGQSENRSHVYIARMDGMQKIENTKKYCHHQDTVETHTLFRTNFGQK